MDTYRFNDYFFIFRIISQQSRKIAYKYHTSLNAFKMLFKAYLKKRYVIDIILLIYLKHVLIL